jgi:amino acid transporter
MSSTTTAAPRPALGLLDAVSLVVGIIVGAGIFKTPSDIFANTPTAAAGMGLWVLGGLMAMIGSLCFAELATAYPTSSGEYVYLRRAYGPFAGFAFAWAQLTAVRTGASLAPMSYVFGEYAQVVYDLGPHSKLIYVTAAIGILTAINALGIQPGRRTQNVLTLAKVLGLTGVVLAGLWVYARPRSELVITPPSQGGSGMLGLALVFVLWAYSGWHELAYVITDLRDRSRNMTRAILLGVAAVIVIYLAVNLSLLAGLGLDTVRRSPAVASTLLEGVLGGPGKTVMAVLVMVTVLGGVNGLIITGGRFFSGFGDLHPGFGWLGAGRTRRGAPLVALVVQAVVSLGMVALVETGDVWKGWIVNWASAYKVDLPLKFAEKTDGFGTLLIATAPVFWFFFLLTSGALLILRVREPDQPRPFRVPLFPVVSILFCGLCLFMLYESADYAIGQRPAEALVVAALFLLGLPVYALTRQGDSHARAETV